MTRALSTVRSVSRETALLVAVTVFYWCALGLGYGMILFGWFMGPGT